MLLMITSHCAMGCEHCMQGAMPLGVDMLMETLTKALDFAAFFDPQKRIPLVLSGGEPTGHPHFGVFCKHISDAGWSFAVCSNGLWLRHGDVREAVLRVSELPGFGGMQVYTNASYYPHYAEVKALYSQHDADGELAKRKIMLDETPIRAMNDLGRAAKSARALADLEKHAYHQPCLVAHLLARQISDPQRFAETMALHGHFCTPLVDMNGFVHMSESRFCTDFGSVKRDAFGRIWERMRTENPCCRCRLGQRFLHERTEKMAQVRNVLGIDSFADVA